jgi:hypothetical protein
VGVQNAWKTPVLALGEKGKMQFQALHSNNREMEFGNWMEYCIKTICGVFQIDPIQIGFDISKNNSSSGSAGMNSGGEQVERIAASRDRGLAPLLRFISGMINDYIVVRLNQDYEFEFSGVNLRNESDELEQSVKEVQNFKTINEVRREHDLEDLPTLDKMTIGDVILSPQFVQVFTTLLQQQQQQQDQEQQEQQGQEQGQQQGQLSQEGASTTQGSDSPEGEQGNPSEEALNDLGPEPDYENMSDEELQAELQKLEKMDKGTTVQKGFYKELLL